MSYPHLTIVSDSFQWDPGINSLIIQQKYIEHLPDTLLNIINTTMKKIYTKIPALVEFWGR